MTRFVVNGILITVLAVLLVGIGSYLVVKKMFTEKNKDYVVVAVLGLMLGCITFAIGADRIGYYKEYVQIDGKVINTKEAENYLSTQSMNTLVMYIKTEKGNYYKVNVHMDEWEAAIKCENDDKYINITGCDGKDVYVGGTKLVKKLDDGDQVSIKLARWCLNKLSENEAQFVDENYDGKRKWDEEMELVE